MVWRNTYLLLLWPAEAAHCVHGRSYRQCAGRCVRCCRHHSDPVPCSSICTSFGSSKSLTNHGNRKPGFDLPRHTWSLSEREFIFHIATTIEQAHNRNAKLGGLPERHLAHQSWPTHDELLPGGGGCRFVGDDGGEGTNSRHWVSVHLPMSC